MINLKYFALSIALGLTKAKPSAERVNSLPSINGGNPFNYEMYSGYLKIPDT